MTRLVSGRTVVLKVPPPASVPVRREQAPALASAYAEFGLRLRTRTTNTRLNGVPIPLEAIQFHPPNKLSARCFDLRIDVVADLTRTQRIDEMSMI